MLAMITRDRAQLSRWLNGAHCSSLRGGPSNLVLDLSWSWGRWFWLLKHDELRGLDQVKGQQVVRRWMSSERELKRWSLEAVFTGQIQVGVEQRVHFKHWLVSDSE